MSEIIFFIGTFHRTNHKRDGFCDKLNSELSKCKWCVGFVGTKPILESGLVNFFSSWVAQIKSAGEVEERPTAVGEIEVSSPGPDQHWGS